MISSCWSRNILCDFFRYLNSSLITRRISSCWSRNILCDVFIYLNSSLITRRISSCWFWRFILCLIYCCPPNRVSNRCFRLRNFVILCFICYLCSLGHRSLNLWSICWFFSIWLRSNYLGCLTVNWSSWLTIFFLLRSCHWCCMTRTRILTISLRPCCCCGCLTVIWSSC